MSNYTGGVTTRCPYYDHESNKSITCQGLIDGTYIMTKFENAAQKNEWQEKSCATFAYGKCPMAKIINKKYD